MINETGTRPKWLQRVFSNSSPWDGPDQPRNPRREFGSLFRRLTGRAQDWVSGFGETGPEPDNVSSRVMAAMHRQLVDHPVSSQNHETCKEPEATKPADGIITDDKWVERVDRVYLRLEKIMGHPVSEPDAKAEKPSSIDPAHRPDPFVAVRARLERIMGSPIDRSARHETTPRHHSTPDICLDFEDVNQRQKLASDLDTIVRAQPPDELNRIGDLYLDRYAQTKKQNPLHLEAATHLFTHSARARNLGGLAGLYDCHRHGAQIQEPRFKGLCELIDLVREEPGAMAKPAYLNLATAIGTPPGYTGENPEDTVVMDDVTALANQVWDCLSRKHYQKAQFERRANAPAAASAPG